MRLDACAPRRKLASRQSAYLAVGLGAIGLGAYDPFFMFWVDSSPPSVIHLASQCYACDEPFTLSGSFINRSVLYILGLIGAGMLSRSLAVLSCYLSCAGYGALSILVLMGWMGLVMAVLAALYRWALQDRIKRSFAKSMWFQLLVYLALIVSASMFIGIFSATGPGGQVLIFSLLGVLIGTLSLRDGIRRWKERRQKGWP